MTGEAIGDTVDIISATETLSFGILIQVTIVACTLILVGLVINASHSQAGKSIGLLIMASGLTIIVQLFLKILLPEHLLYAIDHVKSAKPLK